MPEQPNKINLEPNDDNIYMYALYIKGEFVSDVVVNACFSDVSKTNFAALKDIEAAISIAFDEGFEQGVFAAKDKMQDAMNKI